MTPRTGQLLVCITCAIGSLALVYVGCTHHDAGTPTVLLGVCGVATAVCGMVGR